MDRRRDTDIPARQPHYWHSHNPMSNDSVNLENCDQEPIRTPGAIQPHGALVAVEATTFVISHSSDNLAEFFGIDPHAAIGQHLSVLLDEVDFSRVVLGI